MIRPHTAASSVTVWLVVTVVKARRARVGLNLGFVRHIPVSILLSSDCRRNHRIYTLRSTKGSGEKPQVLDRTAFYKVISRKERNWADQKLEELEERVSSDHVSKFHVIQMTVEGTSTKSVTE